MLQTVGWAGQTLIVNKPVEGIPYNQDRYNKGTYSTNSFSTQWHVMVTIFYQQVVNDWNIQYLTNIL